MVELPDRNPYEPRDWLSAFVTLCPYTNASFWLVRHTMSALLILVTCSIWTNIYLAFLFNRLNIMWLLYIIVQLYWAFMIANSLCNSSKKTKDWFLNSADGGNNSRLDFFAISNPRGSHFSVWRGAEMRLFLQHSCTMLRVVSVEILQFPWHWKMTASLLFVRHIFVKVPFGQ